MMPAVGPSLRIDRATRLGAAIALAIGFLVALCPSPRLGWLANRSPCCLSPGGLAGRIELGHPDERTPLLVSYLGGEAKVASL
jgi:hypothetical protein